MELTASKASAVSMIVDKICKKNDFALDRFVKK
jgi:hypothetical protein